MRQSPDRPGHESIAIAVIAWLGLHIALLWGAWIDLRLAAGAGLNARSLGLSFLLIAELTTASLFFAGLVATNGTALLALAVAFATIQLAANVWLAAGFAATAISIAKVACWLAALRMLHCGLRSNHLLGASALLTLYVLGTTLAWYCLQEFGGNAATTEIAWYASPLLTAPSHAFWVHPIATAALAIVLRRGIRT